MEKLKHSPAPWIAETATCGVSTTYPIKKYESETDRVNPEDATHFRTIQICQIETDLGRANYTEEQRANQKLIAAAPEMLDVLMDLYKNQPDNIHIPTWDKLISVINKLNS